MGKYKKISITLLIISIIFIILGGTLALWTWNSSENKNVVFNTASDLQDYIIYDEGESKFVGDFQVSDSYLDGVHTTISLYKTEEVSNVDLYATINMDINSIGTNIKSLPGLKWVVTSGNSTDSNHEVLSQGNFLGTNDGDTLVLYNNIEVLTTKKEFTIWLWLDSSSNLDSELAGETIDTSVWTQIDQIVEDRYEITNLSVYNRIISATVVNSTANIMYYQVTTGNTEPTEWIEIPEEDIGNIYTLEYNSLNSGTNYVWFKDSNNKVISKDVYVYETYNITYLDIGETTFSGTHEEGYHQNYNTGSITYLDMPTKEGYSFSGYYLNSDGSGETITSISDSQTGDITLYAKWIDNIAPYGVANLSLNDGKFTLSLSDYGDKGSGIINTYGYGLSTSSTCSGASYIESSELSMGFNNTYEAGTKYYGCIKLTDNNGNIRYIVSGGIEYKLSHIEELYTTPGSYEYVVPQSGEYTIELWGAQGDGNNGGTGGYVKGEIYFNSGSRLNLFVGGMATSKDGGYNGGGSGYSTTAGGGGGATDVRYEGTTLQDRIIVASGGGGNSKYNVGSGGGLIGYTAYDSNYSSYTSTGGTQTSGGVVTNYNSGYTAGTNGAFGIGGTGGGASGGGSFGGGGGYYGGAGGSRLSSGNWPGGGGSSYISGHTGSVAIVSENSTSPRTGTNGASCTTGTTDNLCSIHYSGKYFTDTVMIDGNGYIWTNVKGLLQQMPNPNGGYYDSGIGHSGDGAARITATFTIISNTIQLTYNNNDGSGCYSKSVTTGESYGSLCTPVRSGYTFDGWYTSMNGGTQVNKDTLVTSEINHTIYAHWTKSEVPVITFETNGNDEYTKEGISSRIIVTKGNSALDAKTFKYIFSKDSNAEPTNNFINGNTYSLNEGEGIYYLIAEACDINGECTRKVSEPFYLDNVAPSGNVLLSWNENTITVTANIYDNGSGINTYGYLIQSNNTCPEFGYTEVNNNNYSFNISSNEHYYICLKVKDNTNNSSYFSSGKITVDISSLTFDSPNSYSYEVANTGLYKIELWGSSVSLYDNTATNYGYKGGAYTSGIIKLEKGDFLYFYIGEKGIWKGTSTTFNGGGRGYKGNYGSSSSSDYNQNTFQHYSGGGATDVRLVSGDWNNEESLKSRIMVAAGAAYGSGGGGLFSETQISTETTNSVSGASQTTGGENNADSTLNGKFGIGSNGEITSKFYGSRGGGGGYYGGGGSLSSSWDSYDGYNYRSANANGGSSYISGHTGCVSIVSSSSTLPRTGTEGASCITGTTDNLCSIHYSEKYFTNTLMIDGSGYNWTNIKGELQQMPNPTGGYYNNGEGHLGNGFAKITFLNISAEVNITYDNNGGNGCSSELIKSENETYGNLCIPIKEGYEFDGWWTSKTGGTKVIDNTPLNSFFNHTIYAHWK